MLKIVALLLLIWLFFKAVGMIFRSLLGGEDANRAHRFGDNNPGNKRRKGNINIDHNPNKENKGFDGGEYVDYEEVD